MTKDQTVTFTYRKNSYTLTINYVVADGVTTMPESFIHTYKYGDEYSVASPEVEGLTPDRKIVSGIMGAADVTVTVTYSVAPTGDIISVEIQWGDLSFEASYNNWNPDTHRYETTTVEPVSSGQNYIKVNNNSCRHKTSTEEKQQYNRYTAFNQQHIFAVIGKDIAHLSFKQTTLVLIVIKGVAFFLNKDCGII